jgi:tellurite methyltransferase
MNRRIAGFHRDADSHWVAELDCGHGQHVRHDPPFALRAWTQTEEGRAARIGTALDCVRCDRREMPDGFAPYRRTAAFTEASMPAALRGRHSTKRGVWARIHVTRGRLVYRIYEPFDTSEMLAPGTPGVVLPEVEHAVEPLGEVEFHVEFWRPPKVAADPIR